MAIKCFRKNKKCNKPTSVINLPKLVSNINDSAYTTNRRIAVK